MSGLERYSLTEGGSVAKTRLFVSFDFDDDRALRDFLIGQARLADSPFEVTDVSLKEAAPERNWELKARRAVSGADKFLIMLGPRTASARGVLKELRMATELGKPRYQIVGYQDGSAAWAVPGGGQVYRWSWDNVKAILA
jgi:hypothetical protein